MHEPLVSVLMPVYNAQDYLAQAIESILAQSHVNFELLICNDGSTDKSVEIINEYKDSRIRYIENIKNSGISFTRNRLIHDAKGVYIAWLDADDIALPERLLKQVTFLESHSDYGICGSYAKTINQNGVVTGILDHLREDRYLKIDLLFRSSFITSSVMIRKQVLEGLSFDKEYSVTEDYKLWTCLSQHTKMYNLPSILICYRCHDRNISLQKDFELSRLRRKVIADQLDRFYQVSEEELFLFDAIGNMIPVEKIKSWEYYKLTACFKKLIAANNANNIFDRHTLITYLWYRWIVYGIHFKQYKFIIPPFASLNILVLLQLCKLIVKKIIK